MPNHVGMKTLLYLLSRVGRLDLQLVHGELDGLGGGLSPQVVHPSLQTQLPTVEVHRAHLAKVWLGNVDVKGLGLVDVGAPVGRLSQHVLLADLPHSLVQVADFFGDFLKKREIFED